MSVNPDLATIMRVIDNNQDKMPEGEYLEAMNALRDLHHDQQQHHQHQQPQQPQQPHLSIDFSIANQYIESPHVTELHVTGPEVHVNLWPTFKQLMTTNDAASGWKYESSFKYALDCVKCDYNTTSNSSILEDNEMQVRLGFHFIMHIYH
jgi:hypothetical protein